MKAILRRLSKKMVSNESNLQSLNKYEQMRQHAGWPIHVEYLMYLRGLIADEMLGKSFTELNSIEKDVTQRAYAMANDLIVFLLDPMAEARKAVSIKNHNKRMEANRNG